MAPAGTPSASTKPDTPAYAPLPRVPDLTQPAAVCVAWIVAAEHNELIGLGDWYWPAAGELTTGDDVYDVTTHDAETCTICGPLVAPLFPQHPPPPCTCRYAVQHIRDVIGTIPLDLYGIGKRYGVWCFTIDHGCPHHGEPGAHEGRERAYREMDVEEATYWTTLDQDERTGH